MKNKNLEQKLIKILEESDNNKYNIKEIAKKLNISKHKRKELIATIRSMKNVSNPEIKKYPFPQDKHLVEGTFDARPLAKDKSFAFVICADFDVYVSSEDTKNAFHNDKVLVEIKFDRKGKRYGFVREIISRNTNNFTGTIQKFKKKYIFTADNSKIHQNFFVSELNNAKTYEKVLVEVTNWGNEQFGKLPVCEVKEILGIAGEPKIEILSIIKQYDLPIDFPDEVYEELNKFDEEISADAIKKRTDLRNLLTFTIDPESAKDFDDAISLQKTANGIKVYVHIADVSHYVKPGRMLFKEVLNRGNSYYFPKKVIPMLPEKISNKICSLRPFEDKLTLTVETIFDQNFKIIEQKVYESIICSNARFNYNEIDDLFDNGNDEIEPEIADILFEMRDVSRKLSKKRNDAGYIFFDLPEAQFIYDDEGRMIDIIRSKETDSHKLIENFMLLANEFIAKKLSSKETIYRIHGKPDEQKIIKIIELAKNYNIKFKRDKNSNKFLQNILKSMEPKYHRVFDKKILRNMKKAKYSVQNIGHFGLALENYTHFTSPIRRLCDLIVHHQIKNKIHNRSEIFNKKKIIDYAEIATQKELLADEAEREIEIRFKLEFMKTQLGNTFSGVISGMSTSSLFIELDKFPVTGIIYLKEIPDDNYYFVEKTLTVIGKRKGKKYRLADEINVQIVQITDDIYLKEV